MGSSVAFRLRCRPAVPSPARPTSSLGAGKTRRTETVPTRESTSVADVLGPDTGDEGSRSVSEGRARGRRRCDPSLRPRGTVATAVAGPRPLTEGGGRRRSGSGSGLDVVDPGVLATAEAGTGDWKGRTGGPRLSALARSVREWTDGGRALGRRRAGRENRSLTRVDQRSSCLERRTK